MADIKDATIEQLLDELGNKCQYAVTFTDKKGPSFRWSNDNIFMIAGMTRSLARQVERACDMTVGTDTKSLTNIIPFTPKPKSSGEGTK